VVEVSSIREGLDWLQAANGVLLLIVGYLLRERFLALVNLEKKVNQVDIIGMAKTLKRIDKVLYAITYKDRMHRLEDYDRDEDNVNGEDSND
jgi:hypothetical protein